MRLRVVLGVVLLAVSVSPGLAQITSATISGTIKDETGGVLPGVDIVVRNLDTSLTRSVVTDSNGYFAVPRLQIRLEVFNLLNRTNFTVPNRQVFAGAAENEAPLVTAGQVTRTSNAARQIQLGIKLLF